eukprot:5791702-Lingulodinium_polyedra.AAC.1
MPAFDPARAILSWRVRAGALCRHHESAARSQHVARAWACACSASRTARAEVRTLASLRRAP